MSDEQQATAEDAAPWLPPTRLSAEEITDLARRIVTGQVYITNDARGVRMSFGLLMAFGVERMDERFMAAAGAVWEDLGRALPRSINGYPMFMSANFLHVDDIDPLRAEMARMREALGIKEEQA